MDHLSSAGFVLAQSSGRISPTLTALILAALVIIVLWLALRLLRKTTSVSRAKDTSIAEKHHVISAEAQAPVPAPAPAAVKPDDLEIIEGIGPKIAGVLRAAGVTTFAQLAEMEPSKIADLLHTGGIKLVDTRSWPDQARLAAAGDRAGLKDLQNHLKAGHIVK